MTEFEQKVLEELGEIKAGVKYTREELAAHVTADAASFANIDDEIGALQVDAAVAKAAGSKSGLKSGAAASGILVAALEIAKSVLGVR